ncbi:MAG: bifunctional phosphopantothenoylcysteine decarboxylase/phosphopantothenate--cysteine ligase CoaBC [Eubacteriales bacterium]|nr:bifunctional phosphopantothenoylcysteine decarboxylase/phosphopantothenate--cysteine ligase CoaBC [Eubacteriales bacterium]
MLKGKTILLGVTGSIAAYKAAELASLLVKQHCNVHVMMTKNATEFVAPMTFETLTENKVAIDTFDRNFEYNVEHIALAKLADLVLIAPCSANVIAKLANGIADDMLTSTTLACGCKKMLAPAMNTGMYLNPVTQNNLARLKDYSWEVISPTTGLLACGDIGIGKMEEPARILAAVLQDVAFEKDMSDLNVLVTAGPTQEAMDPVRFISNHSSGKMGYAIAEAAARRGAKVTLISGKVALSPPPFINVIPVVSAEEMFEAVIHQSDSADIIIKAAAVADYRPANLSDDKIKKADEDLSIPLVRTTDILNYLGEHRSPKQFLCGFSMETRDLIENSRKKLEKKHLDMIAANNLKTEGAGFEQDTNVLTLITKDSELELPLLSKDVAAHRLLDEIMKRR